MTALATAIRTAREERGWTQGELGARLKVTQATVSFWENGVEAPSLDHQVQLVEAMPEILSALAGRELELLDRIQELERVVFGGKCACQDCACGPESSFTRLSDAARTGKG